MDSPTIATVQALTTLSVHEAAYARDSRGEYPAPIWEYNTLTHGRLALYWWVIVREEVQTYAYSGSGMAVQLLSDLGLHLNLETESNSVDDGHDTNDNTNLRRTIFWATQTLDT
jgi:hypothetical protein